MKDQNEDEDFESWAMRAAEGIELGEEVVSQEPKEETIAAMPDPFEGLEGFDREELEGLLSEDAELAQQEPDLLSALLAPNFDAN